jgi:hypothetical protein
MGIFIFDSPRHFDIWLLRTLGIRIGDYGAIIDVFDGIVSKVNFYVIYRTPAGSWLSGSSHYVNEFSAADRCSNSGLRRHPEYALLSRPMSGPAGGRNLAVGVTPRATSGERLRASTMNLTCATRLGSCTLADLMPLAYSDWLADLEWEQNNHQSLTIEQARCTGPSSSSSVQPPPWWSSGGRRNSAR